MYPYFEQKRKATAGLLFITCSMLMCIVMIFTVTMIRTSSARSVSETVEHTIALECLASCYINNMDSQEWHSNTTFAPTSKDGTAINPLETFNNTMKSYSLMGAASDEKIYMKYSKENSTFVLQIYDWSVTDSLWQQTIKVVPTPATTVIEDNYDAKI